MIVARVNFRSLMQYKKSRSPQASPRIESGANFARSADWRFDTVMRELRKFTNTTKTWRYEMDIYGDRTDWQMKDHDSYETPLEWPKNAFGEELGGGTSDANDTSDDDEMTAEPTDDELDDVEDEDDDHEHGDGEHDHDHGSEAGENVNE